MARKNQAYTEYFQVWDTASSLPVTGDAGNITLYTAKDGGSSGVTSNSPAEVDATNMPGVYSILLTAAEMNGNSIAIAGVSVTANAQINPMFISTEDIKGDTLQLLTDVGNVDTVVDLIKTDTTQLISDVDGVRTDTIQIINDVASVKSDTTSISGDTTNILSDTNQILVDTTAIVAKLPAGTISYMRLNDVVDGAKLRTIFGLMKARVLNKYNVDNPASGDITFFQDDDVSFFARVNVTSAGRTKTSFVDL